MIAKWLRWAADQGLALGQWNLAEAYCDFQHYEDAVLWLRKAAEQGLPGAQCDLCHLYYRGKGVEQDPQEAVQWWRCAARKGCAPARSELALLL